MMEDAVAAAVDAGLLAFAFTAGALAFFAPCSVAMLPAYVAYAVRPTGEAAPLPRTRPAALALLAAGALVALWGATPLLLAGLSGFAPVPVVGPDVETAILLLVLGAAGVALGVALAGRARAAGRGALFGALASLGVLAVFLTLGLPVAFLAHGLGAYAPWLAALVGVALVALGAATLAGRGPALRPPGLRADLGSARGFLLFGVAYGVASLSCTFPVFLGVVAAASLAGGSLAALAAFAAYAGGKASVLVGVTVLTVVGGETAGARVRRFAPAATKAAGAVLVLAGAWTVWYFGRAAVG